MNIDVSNDMSMKSLTKKTKGFEIFFSFFFFKKKN